MPRKYKMSWDGKQGRWVKMFQGKRYTVACSVLGVPATKEQSYLAANAWWETKETQIKAANQSAPRTPLPMEDLATAKLGVAADLFGNVRELLEAALLREVEDGRAGKPIETALPGIADHHDIVEIELTPAYDRTLPRPGIVDPGDIVKVVLDDEPEDAETIRRREVMALLERLLFEDPKLPEAVAERLSPARAAQVDSLAPASVSSEPRNAAWMPSGSNFSRLGGRSLKHGNAPRLPMLRLSRLRLGVGSKRSPGEKKKEPFPSATCASPGEPFHRTRKSRWDITWRRQTKRRSRFERCFDSLLYVSWRK